MREVRESDTIGSQRFKCIYIGRHDRRLQFGFAFATVIRLDRARRYDRDS